MKGDAKVFTSLGVNYGDNGSRQEEDFYATEPRAVYSLIEKLNEYKIKLPNLIVEPAVGNGKIAEQFENNHNILSYDIVDRGYKNTIIKDFFTIDSLPKEPKAIVTNPPYKFSLQFVEHSLNLLDKDEFLIMLLKIQFLETKSRRRLFDKAPPEFVWIFSERIKCLKNDCDNGITSAMCYAWYIWKKGFSGHPQIDWI